MNEELAEILKQPVASVPTAERVAFGLGRNASYDAANRGEIETIQFGKRKVVPTSWIRRKLGLEVAA